MKLHYSIAISLPPIKQTWQITCILVHWMMQLFWKHTFLQGTL